MEIDNTKTIKEVLTEPINSFNDLYKAMASLNAGDKKKVLIALKRTVIKENYKEQEGKKRGR